MKKLVLFCFLFTFALCAQGGWGDKIKATLSPKSVIESVILQLENATNKAFEVKLGFFSGSKEASPKFWLMLSREIGLIDISNCPNDFKDAFTVYHKSVLRASNLVENKPGGIFNISERLSYSKKLSEITLELRDNYDNIATVARKYGVIIENRRILVYPFDR